MKLATGLLQDNPWFIALLGRADAPEIWNWTDCLTALMVFILGSAFWQATARLRQENDYFAPLPESRYNWRTDWLLLPYVSLLLLFIGLTAFISFSSVSKLTFWFGYAACWVGQLTPAGQRFGQRLLRMIQFVFQFGQNQASNPPTAFPQRRTGSAERPPKTFQEGAVH